MKNIKENKGITLVALIITIIVLLILAVVAISAVQGDGIIAHAKNARDSYQTAQNDENAVLGNYLTELNNAQTINNTNNSENVEYYVFEGTDYSCVVKKVNGMLAKKMYFISGNNVTLNSDFPINDATDYNFTPNKNENYVLTTTSYIMDANNQVLIEIPQGTQVTSYFIGSTVDSKGGEIKAEEAYFEYNGKMYCFLGSGVAEFVLDENFDASILNNM